MQESRHGVARRGWSWGIMRQSMRSRWWSRRWIGLAVGACVVGLPVSGGVAGRAGGTTFAGMSRATDVGFAPASSAEGVTLASAKRKRTPVPTATRAASATSTAAATATSMPAASATPTLAAVATNTRPASTSTSAPIEGGGTGDAHVLAVQQGVCKLYEMFNAHPSGSGWNADSGAVFDLSSNALRPEGWTSADAAGLPILAGLVRYDEVQAGAIDHALRFTVGTVQRAWVHPATHYGPTTETARPPYGTRLRLKASFDVSPYHGETRVVPEARKG